MPQYDIPFNAIIMPVVPDSSNAGNCEIAFCLTIKFLNR